MKTILLVFLVVCSLISVAQGLKGDSWAKVKKDGAGTIAVLYNQTPGLIAKQPDGSVRGVCVDILTDFQKFVQEKHNKKISITYSEEADFPQFLSRIQK